jgi:hypothetical protein
VQIHIEGKYLTAYTQYQWRCALHSAHNPLTRQGCTVKLTFAVALVGLVLIAGTTTICMSGAVTERTTEYGFARAIVSHWLGSSSATCR